MPQKTIYLNDIANVGPVLKPKKNRIEWKSVYHVLVGITAEYIQSVLKPKPGDPLSRDLEQFFVHSAETSEKWLARMSSEHDSLSEILDAVDFSKDEGGYSDFASTVSFTIDGELSEITIGDLAFPYTQSFLRIREIEGKNIALLYSQSKEILYRAISGPGAVTDYSEKAEAIIKEPTGIQQNPESIHFRPIDPEKFFNLTDDLRDADKDQRAAISADIDRNLLVVAGAGSGKTRSIVGRICYLHLVKGVPLRKMAALTFMRRARHPLIKSASEQLAEAYRKLGIERTPDEVNISTLDAFFRRLIENHWEEMGFRRKPLFKFDTKKEVKLKILQQIIIDNDYPARKEITDQIKPLLENQPLKDLLSKIEGCADGLVVNIPGIENILNSYIEYQMENHEILEFYASAFIVKRALEINPDLKDRICGDFKCILIDEYQDINRLQNEIFSHLYGSGIHFTLVGDDDQTIYTWRGSDVGIIRDVLKDEDVQKVYLTINYRNNPHIVEAGNSILDRMDVRSKKGMKITPYRDKGPKIRICEVMPDYGELANEIRKIYDPSPEGKKICIMARDSECFEAIKGALQSFNIPSVITKTSSDSDLSLSYKIFKALASIFCGYNVKGSYDMLNELTGERYTNSELKSFIKGGKAFTDSEEGC